MKPGIEGGQFKVQMRSWAGADWRYRVPVPKKHRRFSGLYGWVMGVLENPIAMEDGYSYPVKIIRKPILGWKTDKPKRARILKQQ